MNEIKELDRSDFAAMLRPGYVPRPDPVLARLVAAWFAEHKRQERERAPDGNPGP